MYWVSDYLPQIFPALCMAVMVLASSVFFAAASARAETHIVQLLDFFYAPKDIVINEGDTVIWQGVNDFHNVVSGTTENEDGIFRSDIVNRGNSFSFTFYREILNAQGTHNGLFPYFCEPHVDQGMIGSIMVQRVSKSLTAHASPWQVNFTASKNPAVSCALMINAEETVLSIDCGGITPASIAVYDGGLLQKGAVLCDIGASTSGSCQMNHAIADQLLSGQSFIEINLPELGSLRGQITLSGGNTEVTGIVRVRGGFPLSGAIVTDGTRSTATRPDGQFTLGGVTNGVYELSASRFGYVIIPDMGTSPYIVNGGQVTNRSFTAFPASDNRPARGDIDGDGISDAFSLSKTQFIYLASSDKNKRAVKLKAKGAVTTGRDSQGLTTIYDAAAQGKKLIWTHYTAAGVQTGSKPFGKSIGKVIGGCDFNGDGATDIAVLENRVLRYSLDQGTTTLITRIATRVDALQCQDIDGDGVSELVISKKDKKGVTLLVYTKDNTPVSSTRFIGGSFGFIADINHDGLLDYGAIGELKQKSFLTTGGARYQLGSKTFESAQPIFSRSGTMGLLLRDSKGALWNYHIHMKKPERVKLPALKTAASY